MAVLKYNTQRKHADVQRNIMHTVIGRHHMPLL